MINTLTVQTQLFDRSILGPFIQNRRSSYSTNSRRRNYAANSCNNNKKNSTCQECVRTYPKVSIHPKFYFIYISKYFVSTWASFFQHFVDNFESTDEQIYTFYTMGSGASVRRKSTKLKNKISCASRTAKIVCWLYNGNKHFRCIDGIIQIFNRRVLSLLSILASHIITTWVRIRFGCRMDTETLESFAGSNERIYLNHSVYF